MSWNGMTAYRIVTEEEDNTQARKIKEMLREEYDRGWADAMETVERHGMGGMRSGNYGGNYRHGTMGDRDGDGRYNERDWREGEYRDNGRNYRDMRRL